ncbi:hypothetical protein KJ781_01935 [Patescibacteria group bacterium]|nr:hypothetical protein [Patescibacteria group bacterium]MBU1448347.1 hypothetical protein [Patescibacteria group bacterium]
MEKQTEIRISLWALAASAMLVLGVIVAALAGCYIPPDRESESACGGSAGSNATSTTASDGGASPSDGGSAPVADPDRDGDGVLNDADCQPDNPNVFPGAGDECGNGMDDDCDDEIDEGCGCTPGDTELCYTGTDMTRNVGQCDDGIMTCGSHGTWGSCVEAVTPAGETCNGLDDDCDGSVDEDSVCGSGGGGTGGTTTTSTSTETTTTTSSDGGSGGMAGSGGEGGSGGTTTTTTSSTTTTTTSSDGGSGGSGGEGGSGGTTTTTSSTTTSEPVLGTLSIIVVAQGQDVMHTYDIYGYEEDAFRPGAWVWDSTPNVTVPNVKTVQFDIQVEEGKVFVFNGQTDGGDWWVDSAQTFHVLIGAKWNGAWIHMPVAEWNGVNSYNLMVVADDVACPTDDEDCDGYSSSMEVPQNQRDCGGDDQLRRPNQLETWGDSIDYDCDGQADPLSWQYEVRNAASGLTMELVDWGGTSPVYYPMTYYPSISAYAVKLGSWFSPRNFNVRYWNVSHQAWDWDPVNWQGCHPAFTYGVYESLGDAVVQGGTVVSIAMENCHLVVQQ